MTSALPPRPVIRSCALALNLCARTVSAFVSSPPARILTVPQALDHPAPAEDVRGDDRAAVEHVQPAEVHLHVNLPEDVREAPLGHAPVQRHLAALEAELVVVAAAALLGPFSHAPRSCRDRCPTAPHPRARPHAPLRRFPGCAVPLCSVPVPSAARYRVRWDSIPRSRRGAGSADHASDEGRSSRPRPGASGAGPARARWPAGRRDSR